MSLGCRWRRSCVWYRWHRSWSGRRDSAPARRRNRLSRDDGGLQSLGARRRVEKQRLEPDQGGRSVGASANLLYETSSPKTDSGTATEARAAIVVSGSKPRALKLRHLSVDTDIPPRVKLRSSERPPSAWRCSSVGRAADS